MRTLPKYVDIHRGWYRWREYLGHGKFGRTIKLCREGAPMSEVWRRWEELQDDSGTLRWLIAQYMKSPRFTKNAPRTQRDYKEYAHTINSMQMESGRSFGDVPFRHITRGVIQRYVEKRSQQGAPVRGNREFALLSTAFKWARNQEYMHDNPCKDVYKNPESPKRSYVDTPRFMTVYDLALKHAPWYIPIAMVIAVACRGRKAEVLDLQRPDLRDVGIYMRRRKGSKDNIVRWSPMLRAAINAAIKRPSTVDSMYVLHDNHGQPIRESTFNTAWQRLMVNHVAPAGIERFKFHDLKRKGVSDDLGNWMDGSGHLSSSMRKVYDVKPKEVDSSI